MSEVRVVLIALFCDDAALKLGQIMIYTHIEELLCSSAAKTAV